MIHELFILKITDKSGATKEFIIKDMDHKICYRFENGNWFDDEAWYLDSQARQAGAKLQYSEIKIDTKDNKWFDSYLMVE